MSLTFKLDKKKFKSHLGLFALLALLGLVGCECEIFKPEERVVSATNIVIAAGTNNLSMFTGYRDTLTALVLPLNHTDGEVEWSSDDTNFVTISKIDGTRASYRGIAEGSAIITARVGTNVDTMAIKVLHPPASNIVIAAGTNSLPIFTGYRDTLTALVLPLNHTNGEVEWFSSDTNFVTISKIDGTRASYLGVAEGSATVIARVGINFDTITINVLDLPATNIVIAAGTNTLSILTNERGTLNAFVTPTNHTDGDVEWFSSDTNFVTISKINATEATYSGVGRGSATITARVGANNVMDTIIIQVFETIVVDKDGDGLIDIYDLTMLHHMRYDLDGSHYKTNTHDSGSTNGCPGGQCEGYELVYNLSFDADGDGITWSGSDGSYTLDEGDNHQLYFNVGAGGWEPIGDLSNPFTAIFDGRGFTITGLGVSRDSGSNFGMFACISNAQIRGLGLVSNLAAYTGNEIGRYVGGLIGLLIGSSITNSYTTGTTYRSGSNGIVGGLVGYQSNGNIIACYTTGNTDRGSGIWGTIGGLVGYQKGGNITACYATGNINESTGFAFSVGGLVGYQKKGNITACYATGNVNGVSGQSSSTGGLVGYQNEGNITACYATGNVKGSGLGSGVGGLVGSQYGGNITANYATGDVSSDGGNVRIGGLVGSQLGGNITANYATGNVNGGSEDNDDVGGLVGWQTGGNITASYATGEVRQGNFSNNVGKLVGRTSSYNITASYGFGRGVGVDNDLGAPPVGVSDASQLTLANAGSVWSKAASNTAGAWAFQTGLAPQLFYNDYDGTGAAGTKYHCQNVFNPPEGAVLIPDCGSKILGQ